MAAVKGVLTRPDDLGADFGGVPAISVAQFEFVLLGKPPVTHGGESAIRFMQEIFRTTVLFC
jgi:hypothetical protein